MTKYKVPLMGLVLSLVLACSLALLHSVANGQATHSRKHAMGSPYDHYPWPFNMNNFPLYFGSNTSIAATGEAWMISTNSQALVFHDMNAGTVTLYSPYAATASVLQNLQQVTNLGSTTTNDIYLTTANSDLYASGSLFASGNVYVDRNSQIGFDDATRTVYMWTDGTYLNATGTGKFRLMASGGNTYLYGGETAEDNLIFRSNSVDTFPTITMNGNDDVTTNLNTGDNVIIQENSTTFLSLNRSGSTYADDSDTGTGLLLDHAATTGTGTAIECQSLTAGGTCLRLDGSGAGTDMIGDAWKVTAAGTATFGEIKLNAPVGTGTALISGGNASGDVLKVLADDSDVYPYAQFTGNSNISLFTNANDPIYFYETSNAYEKHDRSGGYYITDAVTDTGWINHLSTITTGTGTAFVCQGLQPGGVCVEIDGSGSGVDLLADSWQVTGAGTATWVSEQIGGGYLDTGVTISSTGSVFAAGELLADGKLTADNTAIGGGYLSTGIVESSTGSIFAAGEILTDQKLTADNTSIGGGYLSTGITESSTGSIFAAGEIVVDGTVKSAVGTSTFAIEEVGGGYLSTGITLLATGSVSMTGDLIVDGSSTIAGTGSFATGTFSNGVTIGGGYGTTGTTVSADGDISTDGQLYVDAPSVFTGTMDINGAGVTLDANQTIAFGADTMTSNLAEFVFNNDVLASNLLTTGSVTASGTVTAATATINDTATVGGGYGSTGVTLDPDGDGRFNGLVTADGGFSATGATSTLGALTIGGGYGATGTSFNADGDGYMNGDLTVDGLISASISTATGTFTNGIDVGGGYGSTGLTISQDGDVKMNGKLTVDGDIDPVNYYGSGFVAASDSVRLDLNDPVKWGGTDSLTTDGDRFQFNNDLIASSLQTAGSMNASTTLLVGGIATMSSTLNVNGANGLVVDTNPVITSTNNIYGGANASDILKIFASNKDATPYISLTGGGYLEHFAPYAGGHFFKINNVTFLSLTDSDVGQSGWTSDIIDGSTVAKNGFLFNHSALTTATGTVHQCNAMSTGTCEATIYDSFDSTSDAWMYRVTDSNDGITDFGIKEGGMVYASGTVTAAQFVGGGAGLTGVSGTDATKVAKAGDTMSGALNISVSAATASLSVYQDSTTDEAGYFYNSNAANTVPALSGITVGTAAASYGVYGSATSAGSGVYGIATYTGSGVFGYNTNAGNGVRGENSSSGSGIYALNSSTGKGLWADAASNSSVHARSTASGTLYSGDFDDAAGTDGTLISLRNGTSETFVVRRAGNVYASGTLSLTATATLSSDVVITGDVLFNTSGGGLYFGSVYGNEIGFNSASLASGTYVVATSSVLVMNNSNKMTWQNNKEILVEGAGMYLVEWGVTLSSSLVNDHVIAGIGINDALQDAGQAHSKSLTAGDQIAYSCKSILSLSAGDRISVMVGHRDAAQAIISINNYNLIATRIGR